MAKTNNCKECEKLIKKIVRFTTALEGLVNIADRSFNISYISRTPNFRVTSKKKLRVR